MDIDYGRVKRRVGFHLYAKITRRTPVDKGTLRQSWYLTDADVQAESLDPVEGKLKTQEDEPRTKLPPRHVAAPPPRNIKLDKNANPYDAIKIINPLPYAVGIEFEGASKQAPSGMVRISVAEVAAGIGRIMGD